MKNSRDIKRNALKMLAAVGVRAEVHYGGKHEAVSWRGKDGRTYTQNIPGSPSDNRAVWNHRSEMRRKLRKSGYATV